MTSHDSVLVVAAHPDDEVLGCGGTIARHTDSGEIVHILFLADGVGARNEKDYEQKKLDRIKSARKAAKMLGAMPPRFLNYPDNQLDSVPLLEIVQNIEKVMNVIRPSIVYTHSSSDLNIDHRITHQAVMTACRPLPEASVKEIYSFETPSSTEWSAEEEMFRPVRFVDINPYTTQKNNALECYHDEMRHFPHPRSLDGIEALSRLRGVTSGLPAAESFQVLRQILPSDDYKKSLMTEESNRNTESVEQKELLKNIQVDIRSGANQLYGTENIDDWIKSLLKNVTLTNVLDICCGTGNQLEIYASRPGFGSFVGVDVSEESLRNTQARLSVFKEKETVTVCDKMENAFSHPVIKNRHFDLVSCCFGLYYSEDFKSTLHNMVEHAKKKGVVLIVGPYGKNNESFFELLERYYVLPEIVTWSSKTFMDQGVVPELEKMVEIEKHTLVNKVTFPTAESLIKYWHNVVFFNEEFADDIDQDIRKHFEKHENFEIEKHIMTIIGHKST